MRRRGLANRREGGCAVVGKDGILLACLGRRWLREEGRLGPPCLGLDLRSLARVRRGWHRMVVLV